MMTGPVVVVSSDSHVGPLLKEDLRQYCPKKYLEEFDEFASRYTTTLYNLEEDGESDAGPRSAYADLRHHLNLRRPGVHNDPSVRLRDMDYDGIAAEAIYHASQNNEPIPWVGEFLGFPEPRDFELAAVGYQIYNRWLADFCSADPERLLGLIHLAAWDIDWCVREVEWAREAGLRGVSFPPPGKPGTRQLNDLAWEPFWSVCAESGFALSTHASGGRFEDYLQGPGGIAIHVYENSGYMGRRAVWWLIFGGVFERHPELKLVTAEQFEGWYVPTLLEMDQLQLTFGSELPRMPSEYLLANVFCGISFPSRAEVEQAGESYPANFLWGRDYPHVEGVFQALPDPDAEPICKVSIRDRFSNVAPEATVQMLGANAVRAYSLDGDYLGKVASDIGALTPEQIAVSPVPDEIPGPNGRSLAFVGYIGPHPVETDRIAHAMQYGDTNPAAATLASRLGS